MATSADDGAATGEPLGTRAPETVRPLPRQFHPDPVVLDPERLDDPERVRRGLVHDLASARARFDQVGHAQMILDLDSRILAVNDAFRGLLGWPREHVVGERVADILAPRYPEWARQDFVALSEGRLASTSGEVSVTAANGRRRSLWVDISPVVDSTGAAPHEMVLIARDLDDLGDIRRRLESQEAFFAALIRRSTDLVVVTDADGRVRYASPSVTEILGHERDEVVGRPISEFLTPVARDDNDVRRVRLLEEGLGAAHRSLVTAVDAWGEERWLDAVVTNCLEDPDIAGVVTNLRDVTDERDAQHALEFSEARFRAIAETAQEGILASAPDGRFLFANDKAAEILGISLDTVYATTAAALFDAAGPRSIDFRLAERASLGTEQYELGYAHPDGSRRTLVVSASALKNDDGIHMGSLGMISDVTTARQAESELRRMALHDALTGLPNRVLLVDRLAMAEARLHREDGRGIAVLFLDLDHFKLINDGLGHDAGDRLLCAVADRLTEAVRETDTVARLGGDEFAVVCEDAGIEDAEIVAARIQQHLARPFDLDGAPLVVSSSIGVALTPPHPPSDLLRHADAAMYEAKSRGRGRIALFEGANADSSDRRLAITSALRTALDDGSLTLGYQAIVDLEDRRLLGMEALLRWEHPALGVVAPVEVVHAAESAGMSFELDRAVIAIAGADLARLRSRGVVDDDVYVSVNVSPRSTQQPRLGEVVRDMLSSTGLPPTCLVLEITEHSIMDNVDQATSLLGQLTSLGVGVSIDDFGTGYNSLVHLQRLPLDVLKIDRSFVAELAARGDSLAIARSIVSLASAIGLATVAEGVETEEQVDILRELGCRVGQGFLWGRAALVDDVAAALDHWRSTD